MQALPCISTLKRLPAGLGYNNCSFCTSWEHIGYVSLKNRQNIVIPIAIWVSQHLSDYKPCGFGPLTIVKELLIDLDDFTKKNLSKKCIITVKKFYNAVQ